METTPAAKQKIKYLVADTTAFINAVQLNDYADNVLTVPDVIKEVRNKRQIRRLCVLPFDLQVREPRPDSVKHCVEFAKKTGDYASLSGIDIKVIALSYELEADNVGTAHLRTEPVMSKVIASKEKPEEFQETNVKLAGWYNPKDGENTDDEEYDDDEEEEKVDIVEQNEESECAEIDLVKKRIEAQLENANSSDCHENKDDKITQEELDTNSSDCQENEDDEITQEELDTLFEKLKCEATEDSSCDILIPQSPTDDDSDCDGDATTTNIQLNTSQTKGDTVEEELAEDDGAWITPANIKKVKKSLAGKVENDVVPLVACMSTDYALQNVLKQLNLHICALDGRVIKHLRTYILRCYACFKTTSIMTKVFCPNCGNKTLKRVAVSLDANGKQVIHINTRRPLSSKYKNQSLPRFQGGKHSRNPILFEDQPIPRQMPSRVAKTKTNALNEDYTAGFSPFVMRDVDSKSALLRSKGHVKEWARNNNFEEDRRRKHYNRVYK